MELELEWIERVGTARRSRDRAPAGRAQPQPRRSRCPPTRPMYGDPTRVRQICSTCWATRASSPATGGSGCGRGGARAGRLARGSRSGHRHRDRAEEGRARIFDEFVQGGRLHHPPVRRHRPRARHHPGLRRLPRGDDPGAERAGSGVGVRAVPAGDRGTREGPVRSRSPGPESPTRNGPNASNAVSTSSSPGSRSARIVAKSSCSVMARIIATRSADPTASPRGPSAPHFRRCRLTAVTGPFATALACRGSPIRAPDAERVARTERRDPVHPVEGRLDTTSSTVPVAMTNSSSPSCPSTHIGSPLRAPTRWK